MPNCLYLTADEVLECLDKTVKSTPWLANETDLGNPRQTPEFAKYFARVLNDKLDEKATNLGEM
ncbi:hypothetical protein [Streptomyces noursei]|uniref:hypothetical protein n=1 Tax=Streptomyces noursei TaxID=1971 RepID=UPI001673E193|nr:hypothetical protein [Streptomyces noursei]MCZ1021181.1 hypothetical protein [Streptomyces noursei]GGX56084.1 hypothetical protein GCM10010341_90900 [Streptomyces noursei]